MTHAHLREFCNGALKAKSIGMGNGTVSIEATELLALLDLAERVEAALKELDSHTDIFKSTFSDRIAGILRGSR